MFFYFINTIKKYHEAKCALLSLGETLFCHIMSVGCIIGTITGSWDIEFKSGRLKSQEQETPKTERTGVWSVSMCEVYWPVWSPITQDYTYQTWWHRTSKRWISSLALVISCLTALTSVSFRSSSAQSEDLLKGMRCTLVSQSVMQHHRLMLIACVQRLMISLRVKSIGAQSPSSPYLNIGPFRGRDQWPHQWQVHDPITPV